MTVFSTNFFKVIDKDKYSSYILPRSKNRSFFACGLSTKMNKLAKASFSLLANNKASSIPSEVAIPCFAK